MVPLVQSAKSFISRVCEEYGHFSIERLVHVEKRGDASACMHADKVTMKGHWDAGKKELGEKAVIKWLFHIALDNLDTTFKISSKRSSYGHKTYNLMEFGLSRSGFIHCNFERVDERKLGSLFGDEFEEDYY